MLKRFLAYEKIHHLYRTAQALPEGDLSESGEYGHLAVYGGRIRVPAEHPVCRGKLWRIAAGLSGGLLLQAETEAGGDRAAAPDDRGAVTPAGIGPVPAACSGPTKEEDKAWNAYSWTW